MKIVIDDKIPFIRGVAETLGECVYRPGAAICRADVQDADALIVRTRTRCDRSLLEGTAVRFVATATIGYDHLDTDYLRRAGIGWTNCPGCNADSVAQYVECVLLRLQLAGHIRPADCTLGVVGVGHVGSRVARMAERLGCRVLLNDPPRSDRGETGFTPLAEIRRKADVITFHTPLVVTGPHPTLHLADAAFFGPGLARRPVIVNSGRGEVVDTAALKAALREGRVRAAVIDTWENEPHIDRELLDRAFLATPHIAGYSADGKANGTRMALEAVARHFGRPAHFCVRPPELPEGYRYHPTATPPCEPLRRYDPLRDSEALKADPAAFEALRGNYPLRRE